MGLHWLGLLLPSQSIMVGFQLVSDYYNLHSQFNSIKKVSNPTFELINSNVEGNGRPFVGPNKQTGNVDYTNQISVSTQPMPTGMRIGTQANAIPLLNVGPYQPPQAVP